MLLQFRSLTRQDLSTRRTSAQWPVASSLLLWALGLSLLGGCAQEISGEDPPEQTFFFPMGIGVSANGNYAYVVNSNFDQRFNTGWIGVLDLKDVLAAADQGATNRTEAIIQQLNVPSLAGSMGINEAGTKGLLPHRGLVEERALVTAVDISADGSTLSCGEVDRDTTNLSTAESRTDCDRGHILRLRRESFNLSPGNLIDPYTAAIVTLLDDQDELREYGVVGYLGAGVLTVLDMSGALPVPAQGIEVSAGGGVSRVRAHPDLGGSFVAATSRIYGSGSNLSTIYSIDLRRSLATRRSIVIQHPIHEQVGGRQVGDLVFSPDGQYSFVSNLEPNSIVALNSRIIDVQEPSGIVRRRPQYAAVDAQAVPGRPAELLYVPRINGDIVVTTNFTDDSLYVLSVQAGQLLAAERLDVGFGPYGLAHASVEGRDILLVSNFLEHSIAIVDISGSTLADFTLLMRIRASGIDEAERVQ